MAERCEVPWSFDHPDDASGASVSDAPRPVALSGQPCPEPAYVVIRDPEGDEGQVCEAHWLDALRRSGGLIRGVRLVRQQ